MGKSVKHSGVRGELSDSIFVPLTLFLQNHRSDGKEPLENILSNSLAQNRMFRAVSRQVLSISKDRVHDISWKLVQGLTPVCPCISCTEVC